MPAQLELLEPIQVPCCFAQGQLFHRFECIDDLMEDLCFLEEWQNFDQLQPLSLRLLPKLKPETAPILDYACDEAAAGKHLRKAHLLLPYLHLLRQHGHNLLHKLSLVEPDPLPLPCARL